MFPIITLFLIPNLDIITDNGICNIILKRAYIDSINTTFAFEKPFTCVRNSTFIAPKNSASAASIL